MADPTELDWTDPTLNEDGSPVAAGEIVSYTVGVRDTSAAGSAPGTYPYGITAPSTATSALLASLTPHLPTGVPLAAAVRADTAGLDAQGQLIHSKWTPEVTFTLATPAPIPQAPTDFKLA